MLQREGARGTAGDHEDFRVVGTTLPDQLNTATIILADLSHDASEETFSDFYDLYRC